jgi:hypothetical protein
MNDHFILIDYIYHHEFKVKDETQVSFATGISDTAPRIFLLNEH